MESHKTQHEWKPNLTSAQTPESQKRRTLKRPPSPSRADAAYKPTSEPPKRPLSRPYSSKITCRRLIPPSPSKSPHARMRVFQCSTPSPSHADAACNSMSPESLKRPASPPYSPKITHAPPLNPTPSSPSSSTPDDPRVELLVALLKEYVATQQPAPPNHSEPIPHHPYRDGKNTRRDKCRCEPNCVIA